MSTGGRASLLGLQTRKLVLVMLGLAAATVFMLLAADCAARTVLSSTKQQLVIIDLVPGDDLLDPNSATLQNPNLLSVSQPNVTMKQSSLSVAKSSQPEQATTMATAAKKPSRQVDDPIMEIYYARRRLHLGKGCESFRKGSPYDKKKPINLLSQAFVNAAKNVIVDETYGFLMCVPPKVASTSWRKVLLALHPDAEFGVSSPDNITDEEVYKARNMRRLRTLSSYSPTEQVRLLAKFKKVTWVRNPFDRLISAYRSKFATHSSDYYTKVVGSKILRKFRVNSTEEQIAAGLGVTVGEFFAFLSDEGYDLSDVHWQRQSDICGVCSICYDYIGQFENLASESDYLLRKLTGRDDIKLPAYTLLGAKSSSYLDTVKDVTTRTLREVIHVFATDFIMFGYQTPKFS